jgi:8-oxo-dGTP pyrophosphatase MutT (NUDIX family)
MTSKNEVSAGGVVYRTSESGGVEVLVSKHSGYHKWVLPKGRVEEGETLDETAVREVEEEVGVKAKILAPINPPEEYVYVFNGERIFKKVQYFLMEYVSGSISSHDFEMEDVKWVDFSQAIELMGYDGAKNVLKKAQDLLEKNRV